MKKVLRVGLDKRVGANFGSTDNSMHSLIKYTFPNKGLLFSPSGCKRLEVISYRSGDEVSS